MRILVIENEAGSPPKVSALLSKYYAIDMTESGDNALRKAAITAYDLIILGISTSDLPGETICHQLREEGITAPILGIATNSSTESLVDLLNAGADDYLTNPFHLNEFEARVRALLRRPKLSYIPTVLYVESLVVNTETRTAYRQDRALALRRKEFEILTYLLRNKDHVVTREMLIEHVWNETIDPFTNVVDVHIKMLRDKMDKPFTKKLIKTVHGLGYMITEP